MAETACPIAEANIATVGKLMQMWGEGKLSTTALPKDEVLTTVAESMMADFTQDCCDGHEPWGPFKNNIEGLEQWYEYQAHDERMFDRTEFAMDPLQCDPGDSVVKMTFSCTVTSKANPAVSSKVVKFSNHITVKDGKISRAEWKWPEGLYEEWKEKFEPVFDV
eukprot:CAMPEP_0204527056 /NCGR_PEP_ID=MMETSP0661-20131031/8770_1 /ASSEMBLY_ACC=CAM_ASM_000606 /TAXON_ID=109239 /ORGANISM="Alexandrium margalefi, Strain AMGDE01CS-322" /LENGTH=163 /DNA_ID=CAMNT_0051532931 /DNA_START=66 /DNA_END=557 /DNA_ORIENTATION=-